MKIAHVRREKKKGKYNLCCDARWCWGFLLLWIGTLLDIWALAWGN